MWLWKSKFRCLPLHALVSTKKYLSQTNCISKCQHTQKVTPFFKTCSFHFCFFSLHTYLLHTHWDHTHTLILPELLQHSPLCQCSSLDFNRMVQTHPSYRLQDPCFLPVHMKNHSMNLHLMCSWISQVRDSPYFLVNTAWKSKAHTICVTWSQCTAVTGCLHPAVRQRCSHHCNVQLQNAHLIL